MFTKPAGVFLQVIGLLFTLLAVGQIAEQTPEHFVIGGLLMALAIVFLWLGRKVKPR